MQAEMFQGLLFPGLKLNEQQLAVVEGALMVDAAACAPAGTCPQCDHPGVRVHSRYWRLEHVQHRFQAGCTSSMQLYRELLALGYTGGCHVVNRYVMAVREGIAVPARSVTPSPRAITSWIMRPQKTLNPSDVPQLEAARSACAEIALACDLAREFTDMLRHRRGHLLRDWIQKAELGGPEAIGIFADSIRQDLHAVAAGLTLPYSSGMVEGHVNRIKTIKRQMYGRASFALLRAPILLQS